MKGYASSRDKLPLNIEPPVEHDFCLDMVI